MCELTRSLFTFLCLLFLHLQWLLPFLLLLSFTHSYHFFIFYFLFISFHFFVIYTHGSAEKCYIKGFPQTTTITTTTYTWREEVHTSFMSLDKSQFFFHSISLFFFVLRGKKGKLFFYNILMMEKLKEDFDGAHTLLLLWKSFNWIWL